MVLGCVVVWRWSGVAVVLAVLGIFFLLTVIAFRTAIFDFSIVGSLATLLTMVFGTVSIAILVLWSAGF